MEQPSHQGSGYYVEVEVERIQEPEGMNDVKETVFFTHNRTDETFEGKEVMTAGTGAAVSVLRVGNGHELLPLTTEVLAINNHLQSGIQWNLICSLNHI